MGVQLFTTRSCSDQNHFLTNTYFKCLWEHFFGKQGTDYFSKILQKKVQITPMGKANATFEVITKYLGNTLLIQSSPRYDTVSFLWLIGNKDWENSRQLSKPETKSKVCITVENSPTPQVFISGYANTEKSFLLLL